MPALAAGDSIVIYNLAASGATANAYVGDKPRGYSSNTPPTITLAPAKQFPFSSPGKRSMWSSTRSPTSAIRRQASCGVTGLRNCGSAAHTASCGSNALLASNVAACSFTYANTGAAQRTGVVMLSLQIQESGSNDSIQLFSAGAT